MILFKIVGASIMVVSAWGFGFYKSFELKEKKDNLLFFSRGLSTLNDDIRLTSKEISPLIRKIFSEKELIVISGDKIVTNETFFYKKDNALINGFLSALGGSDIKGECGKIMAFKDIIDRRIKELDAEYKSKSKVWQTMGFCFGVTVALLMI